MSRLVLLFALALTACDEEPVRETDTELDTERGTEADTEADTEPDTAEPASCSPLAVSLPYTLAGNSFYADFPRDGDFSAGADCTEASGGELGLELELVGGTTLTVVESGGVDVVLHIKEACETTADCLVSVDDYTDDRLDWEVPATGTYVLVVEGWSETANGDYDLLVAATGTEDCEDGVDNDLNGQTDCDDVACAGAEACPFDCPAEVIVPPFTRSGEDFLADATSNLTYADGEGCTGGQGPEMVFDIALERGQTVRVAELDNLDAVVRRVTGCEPGSTCEDSVDYRDRVEFTAAEDGTYTFVVEAYSVSPSVPARVYDVRIDLVEPEQCDDAVDNDLDELADCEDPDCIDTDACPFTCPATPVLTGADLYSAVGQDIAVSGTHRLPYALGEGCSSGTGPALVWQVALAAGETLRMSEVGAVNATWRVLDDCVPTGACLFDAQGDSGNAFRAEHTGVYTVVMQAANTGDTAAYEAYLQRIPAEDCLTPGDEDLDGVADCDDADCLGTDTCPFTCDATPVTDSVVLTGDDFNADFPGQYNYGVGAGCDVGEGSEAVFSVSLLAGQSVRITEAGSIDVALRVSETCLPERSCVASINNPEQLTYTASEDGDYTVVVEARSAASVLPYELRIDILEPEVCNDGVDNDRDLAVDCSDEDCWGDHADCASETVCFDGHDNDLDGLLDCADADCAGGLGCGGGTVVFSEDFDQWPLAGWTIEDGGTEGVTWSDCAAPGCTDILTQHTSFQGATGSFAYINSDDNGTGTTSEDSLVSPTFSLADASDAALFFDHLFDAGGLDSARVEVSVDGGATWVLAAEWTSDTVNGVPAAVSLRAFTGEAFVQVRFRYSSQRDWFWAVDNVEVRVGG